MTKALSYNEIERRVRAHDFELITTPQEWAAARSEHITVRSPSGYEQTRRVDIFAPRAVQATCQYDRLGRKGETLCVLAASALLGTTLIREYTPPVLKGSGYRLDGWAELRRPGGRPVFLALEHQGDHRNNPDAPVHLRRGGAAVSMKEQARRDKDKARLLATDPRIVLVKVPDLLLSTDRERGVVKIVARALEARLRWLRHDRAYRSRKAAILVRLAAGQRVLKLPASWIQDAQERVEAALKATGDDHRLGFVDADPLSRTVTLGCEIHGVLKPVPLNNVLGSADGQRKGTRCLHCANAAVGDRRRLSFDQVVAAARRAGFRPLFAADAYTSNQQELDWQCLRDASHVVQDTLAHIQERGCRHCRGEGRSDQRQAAEFAAVSRLLAERGDALLSTQEHYRNQDSRIRYRCSLCGEVGEQAAVKIKLGQRHACQRHAASQATRRAREFALLVEQIQALGLELLTTADTYAGNRAPILYRKPGRTEILSAPAYRLRVWAKKADKLAA